MTAAIILVVGALVVAARLWQRGRRRRAGATGAPHGARTRHRAAVADSLGDVGLVAQREIHERVRGRIFRVGTLVILIGVAAAIVIPKIQGRTAAPPQRVGVVGTAGPLLDQLVTYSGRQSGTAVRIVPEPTRSAAEEALRSGDLDVAVVDGGRIVVDQPITANDSSTTGRLVQTLAPELGVLRAYQSAGLSAAQIERVAHARPVPVQSLQAGAKQAKPSSTGVIGIILLFLMLTQYNTWILMGVMQEKASRVVEVLLATVRPIQLLGGKVLGIGLVAMGQATLIVAVALVLGAAVGSDLLHGSAPLVLVSQLLWLLLGYAFYCWVYAAAGSMAERQDQVQTLVLPLTLPIVLGYVLALTTAETGNPSLFFKVLAYLPPTAPFAMPVLVGLDDVAWWQFVASVLISIAGTALMARLAAGIYRRAVLRSGARVHLRELWARPAGRAGTRGVPSGVPG
ncbi:MAG: ABC transporter permease [Acidimicrobiales bacterium]